MGDDDRSGAVAGATTGTPGSVARGETMSKRSSAAAPIALLAAMLALASCERTPTKAEFVDHRVGIECAGKTGEAYKLCRLDVIKKYLDVSLEQMQATLPPPPARSVFSCSRAG
jgi:hypothetical protein